MPEKNLKRVTRKSTSKATKKPVTAKVMKNAKTKPKAKSKGVEVNMKVKRSSPVRKKKSTIQKEKQTRIEILQHLAQETDLSKTQVEKLFEAMHKLISSHMHPKGSGEFTVPMTGIKIRRVRKDPSKARKMYSPLIGEEVDIASKPARNGIKLTALKILKETVSK